MNFKVRCTKTIADTLFTKGKIYQVTDGTLVDNQGYRYPNYKNVHLINSDMVSQFELVKEESKVGDFKVRCVSNEGNPNTYTVGEIYEIGAGGTLVADNGFKFDCGFKTVEDINKFSSSKFELVTEPTYFTIDEAEAALTEAEGKKTVITDNKGKPIKR